MANSLTGDYEAVVQIAIRQINGLLATLHQNADDDAPLKLLHSTSVRIGVPPRRRPDVDAFGDWVTAYQKARPGRGLDDLRTQLTSTAPPGAAKVLADAFAAFVDDLVIQLPPDVVRGRAKLQVSSLTITVPSGSSTEITAHAHVRAQYYPDPATTDLPAPVHGEVRATFDVRRDPYPRGRRLLIRPSAQDAKIQFIAAPGTGLTSTDESRIATEVRKVLREGLRMPPIDLPADFMFSDFKGLGSGSNQVIALPFQLSGATSPSNGIQSLTQSFIGSSGFGFGVSRQYVNSLIDLEAIRQGIASQSIERLGATYHLRFSSGPTLTFKNGTIEISGRVEVETNTSWAPNGYVQFKQLVRLVLDPHSQVITLLRAAPADVDESWFIPHGTAFNVVTSEVIKALDENNPTVRRTFDDARSALNKGLDTFDGAAAAQYTAVLITADGVLTRGEILSPARGRQRRRAPVVEIAETHQGAAFTAFESWMPAGRIDRFVWTWVEPLGLGSLSGVTRTAVDEHRFILPKPVSVTHVSQICLRLEGIQTMSSGQAVSTAGGTTCQVAEPEFGIDIPSWLEPLTTPLWKPDLADTDTLREAIAGNLSVQAIFSLHTQPLRNALVYFVDGRRDRPLDGLMAVLAQTRNTAWLVTTIVLPAGSFDTSRGELESRLGVPRESFPTPLLYTEDDEGGWTRTFRVSQTPSIYLINGRGEFVWKHEGEPNPAAVAAALSEYMVPSDRSLFRPVRLTVSPGDAAPDAVFEAGDQQYALHRLRGRDVVLNFWQSWSRPCLTELQRLQRLHQEGEQAPAIIAFHGGSNSGALDDVRKRLGLSYPLVHDSQQRIAQKYGVRCWPTTIKIGANGRVDHIQYGTAHEHEHTRAGNETETAV
jgi:peroxiredoxin